MPNGFEIVFWYWYSLAVALIILEILMPGVIFLWLALGAVVAGTVLLLVPGMDLIYQAMIFAIASAASLLLGQRMLKGWLISPPDPGLNQREKTLIGREAVVIQAISQGTGRVRLGDTSWSVTGPDLPAGAKVRVVAAEGTRLTVAPL